MYTKEIQNNNVFVDEKLKSSKNILLFSLRTITLALAFLSVLITLIFVKKTLLAQSMLPYKSISYFFKFEATTQRTNSFLVLYRFLLLFGTMLFVFYVNYTNLKRYRLLLLNYLPIFIAYTLYALVAFILLFSYYQKDANKLMNLTFILIPLFVIRFYDLILRFAIGKKIDPILYRSHIPFVINIVAKILVYSTILFIFLYWPSQAKNNSLFSEQGKNNFYEFVRNLFANKTAVNLLIVIAIFTYAGILIFANNIYTTVLLVNKRVNASSLQYYLEITFVMFIATCLWFFRALFYEANADNLLDGPNKNSKFYLISIALLAFIFAGFIVSQFFIKNDYRKNNLAFITLILENFLLISSYFFITLFNKDTTINIIILAFCALFIALSDWIFYLKVKKISFQATFFMIGCLMILGLQLAVSGVNQLFLTNEGKNWLFYTLFPPLSLMQVITLTFISFLIANGAYLIILICVIIGKIIHYEKKQTINSQGVTHEE